MMDGMMNNNMMAMYRERTRRAAKKHGVEITAD